MRIANGFRLAVTRALAAIAMAAGTAVVLTVAPTVAAMGAVVAQAAHTDEPPPDAGWTEKDYLLHYATVVCVQASYGTLAPPAALVREALGQEAWAMVELTRQDPAVYDRIHGLAAARGNAEAPARALAACGAWAERHADTILKGAVLGR